MDIGFDEGRSVRVLGGVGESLAGPAKCCEDDDVCISCRGACVFDGDEAEVGERGGAPNADMNDNTESRVRDQRILSHCTNKEKLIAYPVNAPS